jgi:hypothetical protein
MEDLGLIGENISEQEEFELWINELLDEGYDLSEYTWDELYEGYKKLPVGKMMKQAGRKALRAGLKAGNLGYKHPRDEVKFMNKAEDQINKMARVASRHSMIKGKGKVRGEGQAELNRIKGKMKAEEYDLYDLLTDYLIDEGYADCIGSAEIIIENMSDEWLDEILEARDGYGPDEKFYKPEDSAIPNAKWLERIRSEKKKYGRPIGKYDPNQIKLGDVLKQFPENRPGAKPKPKRVIPSRLDKR